MEDELLCLVDVGGAGGLQERWRPHAQALRLVMVEPDAHQAAQLRDMLARDVPEAVVLETGLADTAGPRTLNLARFWGCTSMREPDMALLRRWRIAPLFEVERRVEVGCVRYDALHAAGAAPAPDVIKADVQGFEREVLRGFGTLLDDVLAVEIESHLYPIYQGQALMGEMVELLAGHGLLLRAARPVGNFDGDLVEMDLVFTRPRAAAMALGPARRRKFALACAVLGVSDYASIDPAGPHWQG